MSGKRLLLCPLILFLIVWPLSRQASGNASQGSVGVVASPIPSYPNTTGGLENLMTDMLNSQRQGNKAKLDSFFQSLTLPDSLAWFTAKFGDENCKAVIPGADDCMGPRLALTYSSTARDLPAAAALTLSDLLDEGLDRFEAVNYEEQCAGPQKILPARRLTDELTTTPILSPVLSALAKNREPVYVIWAYSETQETTVGFFVYTRGAFRYIGMPYPATWQNFESAAAANGVAANGVASKPSSDDLTNEVLDVSPVLVDPSVIARTVVVQVRVGPDGVVREAAYVRGPENLKAAAINSVWQKNFGPQTFMSRPEQLETCVNIEVSP